MTTAIPEMNPKIPTPAVERCHKCDNRGWIKHRINSHETKTELCSCPIGQGKSKLSTPSTPNTL